MVHLKHQDGIDVNVIATDDMYGGFGALTLIGTHDMAQVRMLDMYYAFKSELQSFVDFVRSGVRPFPFEETVELMKLVIAGIRSREKDGREVFLDEVL